MKNLLEQPNERTSDQGGKSQRTGGARPKTRNVLTSQWKKTYIPIISVLGGLFILCVILICTLPLTPKKGQESPSGWKSGVFAPFADLSSWVPLSSPYSLSGVPNLAKVEEQTGISYYNLGFIQPDMTTPLDKDGNIRYGWGGLFELSERGNDGYQYPKIKQTIESLKALGAKVTISVGGQLGKAPWVVTSDEDKLYAMYKEILDTYGVSRLDLDIEENNQGEAENKANARAIKRLQDDTGVEIVLTIPIMPSGWQEKQIKIIKAYLEQGVSLSLINSMTMCYGTGVYASEDYGDASIRAIENSVRQMQEIWASFGTSLTEAQAYLKTGATVDIGYESSLYPTFTTAMTKKVVDHAKKHGYGMLSYWSINRDAKMESNSGIKDQFEFLAEMNKFASA